ncbi:MAG: hypothetical protein IPL75_14895, partial [Acidobacteria bacterium]|nr:hypothetical protein [Acidobacteriota bacterium]
MRATRRWLARAGWMCAFSNTCIAFEPSKQRGRPSVATDGVSTPFVHAGGVARLALATAAAMALNPDGREQDRGEATDADVDTLFRILMQCQVIDDVLDYAEDASAGLPSFLTASASLSQALDLTADAARAYAEGSGRTRKVFSRSVWRCGASPWRPHVSFDWPVDAIGMRDRWPIGDGTPATNRRPADESCAGQRRTAAVRD